MKAKKLFSMVLFVLLALQTSGQSITTIGLGHDFTYATDIARDSDGNIYVCDSTDNLIMKIDPNNKTNIISVGNGKPSAIALDSANNLYVSYASPGTNGGKVFKMNNDGSNPVLFSSPDTAIKKMKFFGSYLWFITPGSYHNLGHIHLPDGNVSYTSSFAANISGAEDFTFDDTGNSYFVFPNNNTVLKMDSLMSSYTYSQDSGTHITCIDYCSSIGLILGGMSDIVIMNTAGNVITNYTLPVNGPGQTFIPQMVEARDFHNAHFVIYDTGYFRVYDFKYPDNTFTQRGSKFNTPIGIALDGSNNIYINDYDIATGYNSVKKINSSNYSFSTIYNTIDVLGSLSQNNGYIYLADRTTNQIKSMDTNGVTASTQSGLNNPYVKKINGSNEYVTERNASSIKKFHFSFPNGYTTSNLGAFIDAKGFDFDSNGDLYVADYGSNTIQKMNSSGIQNQLASGFNKPSGVAVDNIHNYIYVTDTENNAVKRMNLDGSNIITIGSGFNKPESLCLDATNTKLYVTDTGNNVVKIIDMSSLGVPEVSIKSDFKIYPNPTTDFINIQISQNNTITKAEVIDITGKIMLSTQSVSENKIDVKALPVGIYLLTIYSQNGKGSLKFIKE